MTDLLREIRPVVPPPFELRFETPPGQQAQVDFAQFQTEFTDEPGVIRIVWLFSLVLGHSRMMWCRFAGSCLRPRAGACASTALPPTCPPRSNPAQSKAQMARKAA